MTTSHYRTSQYQKLRKRRAIEAPSHIEAENDRITDQIAITELRESLDSGGGRGFRL
jgi:hypothetical protein